MHTRSSWLRLAFVSFMPSSAACVVDDPPQLDAGHGQGDSATEQARATEGGEERPRDSAPEMAADACSDGDADAVADAGADMDAWDVSDSSLLADGSSDAGRCRALRVGRRAADDREPHRAAPGWRA